MSANEVATTTSTAITQAKKPSNFELELANYEPQIAAALPAHIPLERFKRTVLTAINQNPDLFNADRRSLFLSCVRAAQDGLFPDGREAALVIFKTKRKVNGREEWVQAVQYMPMIHGIRKRMRNTKEVLSADAQVVYEFDHFDYRLGDEPMIEHRPTMSERGKPVGAYAIIKLANGEVLREVMNYAEIEKVRAVSRAGTTGPWVNWWTEMARKTVLRRCSKAAPTSSDLDEMLRRDDESMFGQERQGGTTVALTGGAPPRPQRADFVEPAPSDDADVEFTGDIANEVSSEMSHDPATGEVHESPASSRHPDDAPKATTAAATPETKTPPPADEEEARDVAAEEEEPDPKLVEEWKRWGTSRTTAIATAKTPAALDKIEKDIRPNLGDYMHFVGAVKAMALEGLIAARRAELAGG